MIGSAKKPDKDDLYEIASVQDGYFTTQQARESGYSAPLLTHHCMTGSLQRIRRGVYRLAHFPPGENEDLVVTWLWSSREGVFSHQTALVIHELSDALPSRVHLTLPIASKARRFRVPPNVILHHADIPPEDRMWHGPIPLTAPRRTLLDCVRSGTSPELLEQAIRQARRRGILHAFEPELDPASTWKPS